MIKDDIESLKDKQKDLEDRIESAKQETGNNLNSILKSESSTEKHVKFSLPGEEMPATSEVPKPTQESAAVGESGGDQETNTVSAMIVLLDTESESREGCLFQKSLKSSILIS